MRVVVTGATGFIGGAAARALQRSGHDVTGIGRNQEAGERLRADGIYFVLMDIREPYWVDLLEGTDVVVHAAAAHTVWDRWETYRDTNIEASAALARSCKAFGTRMVYISHSAVYNLSRRQWGIPESEPCGPRFDSLYSLSKYLAEQEIQQLLPAACILRLRRVYGPGDTTFMPRLADALRERRLPRLAHREVHNQLLHIGNAVEAIELAVSSRVSGPVNLGDSELVGMWSLVDQVADAIGAPRPQHYVPAGLAVLAAKTVEWWARRRCLEPPFTVGEVKILTRGLSLDLTRAQTELGYWPVVETEVGLHAAIEALRPRRAAS